MSKNNIQQALTALAGIPVGFSLPALNGKLTRSSTRYIAGTGLSLSTTNGQTILASTVPAVGVTNFPKGNTLPEGTEYLVVGVRILFDTVADKTTKTAEFESDAPAAYKNGEIQIAQNGTGVLFESSISDVTNFRASTGNDEDFREVVPFLIRSGAPFEIQLKLADAAAANQLYKIELRVIELVPHTQA